MAVDIRYIIFAVLIASGSSNSLNLTQTWRFVGWRVQCHKATPTGYSIGLLDCIHGCRQKIDCKTVTYESESRQCMQCDRERFRAYESSNSTIVIVKSVGLIMLSRESVSFNYSEAQERCNRFLGGRLLTLVEVTDLYNSGFDKCKCTWLQDGSMMSVIQEGSGCKKSYGVNTCNKTRADAWCTGSPFFV